MDWDSYAGIDRSTYYPAGVQVGPERIPHVGHMNHLCYLAEHGNATLEQIKALVKNPKFICRNCGRVAAKAENLCEPVPL